VAFTRAPIVDNESKPSPRSPEAPCDNAGFCVDEMSRKACEGTDIIFEVELVYDT
jgi:hypothetical protein